jgi:pimeloyl-ACP methyl ester carboxylesterase
VFASGAAKAASLHFFSRVGNLAPALATENSNHATRNVRRLPVVLVPGLTCSARLYADQIPALWRLGPVTVADHTRDDSIAAVARRILAAAPPRFALAGLSMGGYIAFEIMRQAPERVAKLALLDTSARGEAPEQTERRKAVIALAKSGRYAEVADIAFLSWAIARTTCFKAMSSWRLRCT